jgi:hypothetical protein
MLELQGDNISKEERAKYVERVRYDIEWLDIADLEIRDTTVSEWIATF